MTDYRDNVSEDSEDYERVRELIDIDETITSRESSDFPDSFWEEFRRLNISSDRLSRNERELSSSESEPPADTNAGSSLRFELNAANVEVANVTRLVDDSEITETEARIIERRKEANLRTIVEIERSMKVSLCYVLDCTGSMSRHIAAAKDCILQVIEFFKSVNPCIKFRLGFCGYRDHCDGRSRLQIFNFTSSCEEFRTNLTTVKATGGGDGPEDVLGGLNAAITNMEWGDGTKVLFHIGDYPPHGRRFTTMEDSYPDGDPNGLTAENVLREMQSKNIFYAFGKITKHTDTMIEVFRSIIDEFSIYELIGDDPLELINKFVAATTKSVNMSITLNSYSKGMYCSRFPREGRDINPNVPENWNGLLPREGIILCYYLPKNIMELQNRLYFEKENLIAKHFNFKIAHDPFAAGEERYCYYAINTKCNPPRRIVMKELLSEREDTFEKYLEVAEISAITTYLTIKFNSIAGRKNIPLVNFVRVHLVRAIINGRTRYYSTEPELQGAEFRRFNSNSGFIREYRPVLEAFSHFTYQHTEKYLVVCDLQGIEHPTGQFLLTDPAIHCLDNVRFGTTNLGENGIERCFLANHRCNDVCIKLNLSIIGNE
ncbi:kinase-like protein [Gigaspora margarita]|uniref:Kinase-like protein n=1 Tax=Gigaspora margarita TaxID=4874 RepID=A0A8H4AZG5_GIGMA|nr:kinase-like protein [Gigaspora margarita]